MTRPPIQEDEEVKSKSQIKREMQALRDLGKALLNCNASNLAKLSLNEEIREAVERGKTFKRQALKRQIGYIGGLLREIDADKIRDELEQINRPDVEATRVLHQIEDWREQLLKGDTTLENQLIVSLQADRQKLRQLIRNARRELNQGHSPKYSRQLFSYLRSLHDLGRHRDTD